MKLHDIVLVCPLLLALCDGSQLRKQPLFEEVPLENLAESNRELSGTVECPTPEAVGDVFYTATIELLASSDLNCNPYEQWWIQNNLDLGFEYGIQQSQFPGAMQTTSDICPLTRRRAVEEHEEEEEENPEPLMREQHTSWWGRSLSALTSRKLPLSAELIKRLVFTIEGRCLFCKKDDSDRRQRERRQLSGAKVLIVIQTDYYPQEMSWEIRSANSPDAVLAGGPYTEKATKLTRPAYITDGNYLFVAKDDYSDGWCCGYGSGSAAIYLGDQEIESQRIVYEDGTFSSSRTHPFTISGGSPSTQSGGESSSTTFESFRVQLQSDIQQHMQTYLDYNYYNNAACLRGKDPTISLTLAESEASGSCGD